MAGLRVAMYTDNGIMSPTSETAAAVRAAATAWSKLAPSWKRPSSNAGAHGRPGQQPFRGRWASLGAPALRHAGTVEMHPLLRQRFDEVKAVEVAEFTALLEDVDRFRSAMLTFMNNTTLSSARRVPIQPHPTGC